MSCLSFSLLYSLSHFIEINHCKMHKIDVGLSTACNFTHRSINWTLRSREIHKIQWDEKIFESEYFLSMISWHFHISMLHSLAWLHYIQFDEQINMRDALKTKYYIFSISHRMFVMCKHMREDAKHGICIHLCNY